MNNMQLKDKLRNISNRENIEFNIVLRNYMYERFIERLANSKYKENFILKGGYLLSLVFGLNKRQTIDIDLSLKKETLTKENILKIMNEIREVNIDDNANIMINNIESIREEDEYGGYRVKITVKIENIRENFNIDIATGDPITPREIILKYKTMFDYKYIDLRSYNLETILAEKIETILSRKELNGRAKDFYDIYLIYTLSKQKIDRSVLRKAMTSTFKKRNFNGEIKESLEVIQNSYILQQRWNSYIKHNKYIKNISYQDIMQCLEKMIEVLETETI